MWCPFKNVTIFFEDEDVRSAKELETSLNINLSRPPDAFMHSSGLDKKLQHNPSQNLFFSPIELGENFLEFCCTCFSSLALIGFEKKCQNLLLGHAYHFSTVSPHFWTSFSSWKGNSIDFPILNSGVAYVFPRDSRRQQQQLSWFHPTAQSRSLLIWSPSFPELHN